MGFFNELKELVKDISAINKEFVSDTKEIAAETKRDIIEDWKRDAPILGYTAEKIDQGLTTINNLGEQIQDPRTPPGNLDNKLKKDINKSQHLKVDCIGYSHHALSLNEHEVIHYQNGFIKIDSLENFAKGAEIYILDTPRLYKKDEVINRAYSRLGEARYNLVFNNCEHFVKWTLNGAE